MKRFLAMLALGLMAALGACSTNSSKGPTYPVVGTVDQTTMEQSAFAARSAYAAGLHAMRQYVDLPRCVTGGPVICSHQTVVNTMRQYERTADVATRGAVDLARSPTKTPIALANAVSDAQRAVEVFTKTVNAFKAS